MTGMTSSAVLIAPAALRAAANALAGAMDWGADCYSIPLSPTGAAPATHWGLRTWASEGFEAVVDAAGRGELPNEIAGTFDPAQVAALVGALTVDIRADVTDPAAHFEAVLESAGLMRIEEPSAG